MPEIYDPSTANRPIRVTGVACLRHPVLRATFDDGATRIVDFSDILAKGGAFVTLRFKEAFRDVSVIHDGHAIGWFNGLDFCADALRIKGDEQAAAAATAETTAEASS